MMEMIKMMRANRWLSKATITKGDRYRWTGNLLFRPRPKTRDTKGGGTWTFLTLFWRRLAKIMKSGSKGLSWKESCYLCVSACSWEQPQQCKQKGIWCKYWWYTWQKMANTKVQMMQLYTTEHLNSSSSKGCVFEKLFCSLKQRNLENWEFLFGCQIIHSFTQYFTILM